MIVHIDVTEDELYKAYVKMIANMHKLPSFLKVKFVLIQDDPQLPEIYLNEPCIPEKLVSGA